MTVEGSTIRDNLAYDSGGGVSVGNDTVIRGSYITNNTARYNVNFNDVGQALGGGIYVYDDAALEVYDTTIDKNETDAAASLTAFGNSGGGIYVFPNADLSGGAVWIERSTINDNYAQREGGGVFGRYSTTLHNVTVANNRVDGDGGGVFGSALGATILQHATVVGNVADVDEDGSGDGGGLAGSIRTDHTLIALNEDPSSTDLVDCSGDIVSLGYSFIGVTDGCPSFKQAGTDLVGDEIEPLDPLLALPLAAHGGPTQTIALKPESPAVDAGSPTCGGATLDQRGGTRPLDGDGSMTSQCDIGAVELRLDSCETGPVVIAGPEYFSGQNQVSSTTTLSTTGEVVIITGSLIEFIADDAGSISLGGGFAVQHGARFRLTLADTICS